MMYCVLQLDADANANANADANANAETCPHSLYSDWIVQSLDIGGLGVE